MEHADHAPVPVRDPGGHIVCLACGGILLHYSGSWVQWQLPDRR